MRSIYIHIPFCDNICSYCDFCKIYYNKNLVDKYLDELENELNKKYKNNIIDTIYIGGGTPSSLDYNQLKKLLTILNKIKKSKQYEYTIECNPENMTKEKVKLINEFGINRVSIGVQTFNEDNLKLLNRHHTNKMVFDLIDNLNQNKINNINIDMMFAIPNQTLENLKNDLDIISKLNIKHVSYYSLILEEHTKLYIDKFKVFDENLEFLMYNTICKKLQSLGFNHYEISNFSIANYESKHNLTYWKNNEYLALGLGACSYVDNRIYENTRNINKYLEGKYVKDEKKLDKNDIYINELMLGFRLIKGINKIEFRKKYNKDITDVFYFDKEIKNNRVIDDGSNIYINPEYIYISNDIIVNIMLEGAVVNG